MTDFLHLAVPFLAAAAVSWSVTPLIIVAYRRLGMVASPADRRPMDTHDRPVPRGGGIPILASIAAGILLFLPIDQHLLGILAGAVMIAAVGVLDDRFNLNPYLRLGLLFAAAAAVVTGGIGIPFITVPFFGIIPLDQPQLSFMFFGKVRSLWILADLFGLFWIVGLMNAVNWSKGLDGQLPGVVVLAALTIGILSLRFQADRSQWPVLLLSMITAGAYAGFLPWNFYPQKVMPGFGGGTLGGYLLAVLSILSTAKVGTLLIVLGIPLVDAGFTVFRRLARGKSPVWGDRGHLHHHLLDDLHWSKRQVSLFYWMITGLLGAAALRLNSRQKFYTIVTVGLVLGGVLLWLTQYGRSSRPRARSDG